MDNSSKVIEFLVSDQETGVRVDKALTFFDLSLSRSYIKKLILNGSIYINNDKISLFYIHKALLRNAELDSLAIVSD